MSESLQKCSSEWCSLKQRMADNLKFRCGRFKFVLPPLPIGILKIPDLSSCKGPVFSVLQGKFGCLVEGVCLPPGISCDSGTYSISCGIHVHNAATLSPFAMRLSQFSICDQSECLHGHYRNYSLSEDDSYSLRYLKLNNYVLGLSICCLVDTGHFGRTFCIHRQCILWRFLWNVNEYIPNSIASYPRIRSRFFWNVSKYLWYCILLYQKKRNRRFVYNNVTYLPHYAISQPSRKLTIQSLLWEYHLTISALFQVLTTVTTK